MFEQVQEHCTYEETGLADGQEIVGILCLNYGTTRGSGKGQHNFRFFYVHAFLAINGYLDLVPHDDVISDDLVLSVRPRYPELSRFSTVLL